MAVHQSRLVEYGHWRAMGVRWIEGLCIRNTPFLSAIDLITSHTTGLCPVLAADPSTKRDCIRLDHAAYLELAAYYQPSSRSTVIGISLMLALVQTRRNINQAVRNERS